MIAALSCAPMVEALTYEINRGSDLVGELQSYTVQKGDSFADIARKYDLGIIELQEANPTVNGKKALPVNTVLIIPTEFILPSGAPREGIVLNLAELRLYYFPPNTNQVVTFPVGIGRSGWRTPTGETKIVQKRANPVWIPPDSIRAEAAANGKTLPAVYPSGPKNPLGLFAINLDLPGYRIHGTNSPSSIGLRSSHGCIRMYAEDIDSLFHMVDVGTKVSLIHEPFKIGVKYGQLYLEAHQPFPEQYYTKGDNDEEMINDAMTAAQGQANKDVNWSEVKKLIKDTYGYPVKITNVP